MGVVLAAGFAAGIRAAVANENTDPDILAIMAQLPNDQAPGVCDVPKATGSGKAAASVPASAAARPSASTAASASATASATAPASTAATAGKPSPDASATPSSPADCAHGDQGGPFAGDFVSIDNVTTKVREASPGRDASRGTFVSVCGRNDNNHHNPDNFIVAPGVSNGAHHVHDYVGNLSTDGFSTDRSLAAAGTTCKGNDQSTYFWPVLRLRSKAGPDVNEPGGSPDGNIGTILRPASVKLEFRGNVKSKVRAMPRFLRVITGDAKAATNGPTNARAAWTCSGFEDRTTVKYPVCPQGSRVERILDFPSCWDGRSIDSANHRSHIVFPKNDGSCWQKTVAVPQLRMVLGYDVPAKSVISLDTFPEQKHNPLTDHADFTNVMPDSLMKSAVHCINTGHDCDADGALGDDPGTAAPTPAPTATRSGATSPTPPAPAEATSAAGHTHAAAPRNPAAQQVPAAPPAVQPNRTPVTGGNQQPVAPAPGAATPPAPGAPVAPAGGGTAPTAGGTDGQSGAQPAPAGGTNDPAVAAPGQADSAQQQVSEPPLPGLVGAAGAPGAPGGATPTGAQAASQPALAATGNSRTVLYVLNGALLAALAGWVGMMVRRRRLR